MILYVQTLIVLKISHNECMKWMNINTQQYVQIKIQNSNPYCQVSRVAWSLPPRSYLPLSESVF